MDPEDEKISDSDRVVIFEKIWKVGDVISDLIKIGDMFDWVLSRKDFFKVPGNECERAFLEMYEIEGILERYRQGYRISDTGVYVLRGVYIIKTKTKLLDEGELS